MTSKMNQSNRVSIRFDSSKPCDAKTGQTIASPKLLAMNHDAAWPYSARNTPTSQQPKYPIIPST